MLNCGMLRPWGNSRTRPILDILFHHTRSKWDLKPFSPSIFSQSLDLGSRDPLCVEQSHVSTILDSWLLSNNSDLCLIDILDHSLHNDESAMKFRFKIQLERTAEREEIVWTEEKFRVHSSSRSPIPNPLYSRGIHIHGEGGHRRPSMSTKTIAAAAAVLCDLLQVLSRFQWQQQQQLLSLPESVLSSVFARTVHLFPPSESPFSLRLSMEGITNYYFLKVQNPELDRKGQQASSRCLRLRVTTRCSWWLSSP